MKKALKTETIREIFKSKTRFISLFAMVLLGALVVVGLFITGENMRLSLDRYLIEHNQPDITLTQTYSFNNEDEVILNRLDEANHISLGRFVDVKIMDTENMLRLYSLEKDSINYEIKEGRLPNNANEIAVDYNSNFDVLVGDSLTLEYFEIQKNDKPLKRTSYKVVGKILSPENLSIHVKKSSIYGKGEVDAFGVILGENFANDGFEIARIYLKNDFGSKISDDYRSYANEQKQKLIELFSNRPEKRLKEIKDDLFSETQKNEKKLKDAKNKIEDNRKKLQDATKDLEDGFKEYEDKKKDFDEKILDAREKINKEEKKLIDGEKELKDGEKELKENKLKLEKEFKDAEEKLKEGKEKLDSGQKEYEDGLKKLSDGKRLLEDEKKKALSKLDSSKIELEAGEKKYQDGLIEYENGKREFDEKIASAENDIISSQNKLDSAKIEIEKAKAEIESKEAYLKQKEKELEDGENNLKENESVIENLRSVVLPDLENKSSDISSNIENLKSQVQALKSQLENETDPTIISAINSKISQLENKINELTNTKAEIDIKISQIKSQILKFDQAKAKLSEARSELNEGKKALEEAKIKLKAYEDEYQNGLIKLEAGKKRLEKEKKAGEVKLQNAKRKLDAAKKELDDAKAKLKEGSKIIEEKFKPEEDKLRESEIKLQNAKDDLDKGKKEYSDSYEKFIKEKENAEKKLEDGENKLKDSRKKLEDGKNKIKDAKLELKKNEDEGKAKLNDAYSKLLKGQKDLEDNYDKFNKEVSEKNDDIKKGEEDINDAKTSISKLNTPKYKINTINDDHAINIYRTNAARMDLLSMIFPVFFYLIAMLVTTTTMKRMVEKDRQQIGIKKALGFTNREISYKYLVYGLISSILGSIIGIYLAHSLITKIIFKAYSSGYVVDTMKDKFYPLYSILAFVLSISLILLTIKITLNSSLKENAASLLRPKAPKGGTRIFLEKIKPIWSRLNFLTKVTYRNLFRYKGRMIMTIVGVAGCFALIYMGIGIKDSVSNIFPVQFDELLNYDLNIIINDDLDKGYLNKVEQKLSRDDFISSFIDIRFKLGEISRGKEPDLNVFIMSANDEKKFENFVTLREKNGNKLSLADEDVILSEKLKKIIPNKDFLEYEDTDGKSRKLNINSTTENYIGNYIYLSKEKYDEIYGNEKSNSILVKLNNISSEEKAELISNIINTEGVQSVLDLSKTGTNISSLLDAINSVVGVILVVSSILAIVVLFNLTNINIEERIVELSTIKVLGFYSEEVTAYIYREASILTLVGIILGYGLGRALHWFIITIIVPDDVMLYHRVFTSNFIITTLFTISLSFIVMIIMHFKLKSVDMVEALKSGE